MCLSNSQSIIMNSGPETKKVAVIGGGVAGLAASWHLCKNSSHDVYLFEAAGTLGGHAHTAKVGDVDVDVGFMVFNDDNYPNMKRWFEKLGVADENSDMSLSVSLDGGQTVEWNSDGVNGLFARRIQALSPSFYKFFWEMLRFNSEASKILSLPPDDVRRFVTTGQYLRDNGYSEAFCSYYLLPMMAALWSASIQDVLQFPAEQLIGFLCNHKMLNLLDRPQWKTVSGRSQTYTIKMKSILADRAHLNTPIVKAQKKTDGSYELFSSENRSVGVFNDLVFACHPPTAKAILESGGGFAEKHLLQLLSQIEYADNVIYVHSDPNLMPLRKRAWSSWNCLGKYSLLSNTNKSNQGESFEGGESGFGNKLRTTELEGEEGRMKAVYVTYWLNRLQNLKTDQNIFVSLNPHQTPDRSLTHKRMIMAHPQFNPLTTRSRKELEEKYQGKNGLWFCGAWAGYGFHEDGCRSGFGVATKLSGTPLPWGSDTAMVLSPPDLSSSSSSGSDLGNMLRQVYETLTYSLPVAICKPFIFYFLKNAVQKGKLQLKFNDGSIVSFGDGSYSGWGDDSPVTLRIFDNWFFVKTAMEYDLGLARSYMAGHFVVEPLADVTDYHPVIRPQKARNETSPVLGDPIGLTRLFLLLIGNRDNTAEKYNPRRAAIGHFYSNAMTNASGLIISKIGSFLNFLRYRLTMDNSERGGSLKNIHAHYDLSNDLFRTFLDKETLMYSSAIYDTIVAPAAGQSGLVFRGTLEQAQWRKLNNLLERAQIQPGQTMLDIGFGWGGLSIHAAKKYGCRVTGITLSLEQKALADERVKKAGVEHLIKFEVVDYRTFARRRENQGKFDRVLSCEMIEAVGHDHLLSFFWAVEQVLNRHGILVMEAITTPEQRYETYRRSTDFINTIIFPGSCCPSLHALIDAAYEGSNLSLEHIDNIGLHYAQTLAEWRRRFNASEATVRSLGFDDVFLRAWNYYFTYCESGFFTQTENCLILVFARQGCKALTPLCMTRCVAQLPPMSNDEIKNWISGAE